MITAIPTRPTVRRAVGRLTKVPTREMTLYSFPSQLGWMALAADGETVYGLTFGHEVSPAAIRSLKRIGTDYPNDMGRLCDAAEEIRSLAERLQKFAQGEKTDFLDVRLNLEHLTPFGERVAQRCRRIAWGKTLSYRGLAEACGRPGAARAVGNVMRNNRFPLIVPCHRVLASDGSLGGYSAPQGLIMKERLLDMERRC